MKTAGTELAPLTALHSICDILQVSPSSIKELNTVFILINAPGAQGFITHLFGSVKRTHSQ
ncbi:hypothetical protein CI610_02631 [invertebrate metagenome]|uniref:Uncharacterized protein n=1 Tax=invertebrate metagenome TaxID=1711999 RepID=A0A2H9T5C2_9ZZZZ